MAKNTIKKAKKQPAHTAVQMAPNGHEVAKMPALTLHTRPASTPPTPVYQYKYIIDGQWVPDPLATEDVFNQHGTLNSVIEVPA